MVLTPLGAQVHVLGGSGPAPASEGSVEERRRKLLLSIMSRFKEEGQNSLCHCASESDPIALGQHIESIRRQIL